MQENEFEKQVKQKMDELWLAPSKPVWPKIEEELRGKRKRRLILIPLFAGLLLAGYFTWSLFIRENKIASYTKESSIKDKADENKNSADKKIDKVSTPSDELKSKPKTDQPSSVNVKAADTDAENIIKEEKKLNNKTSHKKTIDNKNDKNVTVAEDKTQITLVKNKKASLVTVKDPRINKKENRNDLLKNKNVLPEQAVVESNKAVYAEMNNVPVENQFTLNNKSLRDNEPVMIDYSLPLNHPYADSINKATLVSLQVPSLNNPDRKGTSNTLKLGIVFSAGASSRVNKPLQINSSEKSASNSFAAGLDRYTSFSTVGGGVSILPPSDVKPGAAFKIGVIAMKPVSRRFDISAGLQYSYSSDHIRVGKSIGAVPGYNNSTSLAVLAQAYYPNVQNENHTNKYHFIELPVSVYYNLNRKWKTPIVWNVGTSVSRLVSSDVLLYDITWGGIYYKGNDDLYKTQINLSTGFSFRFTSGNRWQWNIGPQVYISATKLFQSAYDKNQHPLYGGLSVQVLLPGKKK